MRPRRSEIGNTSIVAPIGLGTPPKRVILGTANLASLGIDIAGKLWGSAPSDVGVEFLALASGVDVDVQISTFGLRVGRLIDLHDGCLGSECFYRCCIFRRWILTRSRESAASSGLALQALKELLFFFGQTWGRRARGPSRSKRLEGGECAGWL